MEFGRVWAVWGSMTGILSEQKPSKRTRKPPGLGQGRHTSRTAGQWFFLDQKRRHDDIVTLPGPQDDVPVAAGDARQNPSVDTYAFMVTARFRNGPSTSSWAGGPPPAFPAWVSEGCLPLAGGF